MKKNHLLYILGLLTIISASWFLFLQIDKTAEQGSDLGIGSDNSQINTDIFPLYEGVTWGKAALVKDEAGEYWRVVSNTISNITNIYELAGPFAEYYDQKLTSAGWVRDINREASGPGSNISYYEKNGEFITIAYDSDFKVENENAPSECPCDLRFTITSGQIK